MLSDNAIHLTFTCTHAHVCAHTHTHTHTHTYIVQLGSTAVGICTSEGVVLAVEKRVTSVLMEPSSIEKILEIDSHIGETI